MPKEFSRTRRVGEQMQRELAQLIQQEIHDPRLGMVTVSAVKVTRDLSLARVYITVLGEDADPAQSLKVLSGASGFLRHELARRMVIRSVPELRFQFDESVVRGREISSLIDEALAEDRKKKHD